MSEKIFVQRSEITKKARQIQKEKSVQYHGALDEAAQSFGFSNFKNYKTEIARQRKELEARLEAGADFAMEEQSRKMAEKFSLIYPVFEKFHVPIQGLINTFKKTKHSDEEIQSVCEKESTIKAYLELYFLQDSLEDIDWDLVTIAPYHTPKKVSVKDLVYKFGKNAFDEETDSEDLYIEGYYEVQCETIFEHTQEDVENHPGFFDDKNLFGSFELTISKNKEVTIEHSDIGWEF